VVSGGAEVGSGGGLIVASDALAVVVVPEEGIVTEVDEPVLLSPDFHGLA
jgi:hypothetical protein